MCTIYRAPNHIYSGKKKRIHSMNWSRLRLTLITWNIFTSRHNIQTKWRRSTKQIDSICCCFISHIWRDKLKQPDAVIYIHMSQLSAPKCQQRTIHIGIDNYAFVCQYLIISHETKGKKIAFTYSRFLGIKYTAIMVANHIETSIQNLYTLFLSRPISARVYKFVFKVQQTQMWCKCDHRTQYMRLLFFYFF